MTLWPMVISFSVTCHTQLENRDTENGLNCIVLISYEGRPEVIKSDKIAIAYNIQNETAKKEKNVSISIVHFHIQWWIGRRILYKMKFDYVNRLFHFDHVTAKAHFPITSFIPEAFSILFFFHHFLFHNTDIDKCALSIFDHLRCSFASAILIIVFSGFLFSIWRTRTNGKYILRRGKCDERWKKKEKLQPAKTKTNRI